MLIGLEYIKYRWKAKGRHGIHSPFVYDFVDKCLVTPFNKMDKEQINLLHVSLAKNEKSIEIVDAGAGSKRLGTHRKIKDIYSTSSSKGKYGELLYRLCKHYTPKEILEFGTSLGVGTTYMSLGNPNASITTIEACPNTSEIAKENFNRIQFKETINQVNSTFRDFLKQETSKEYDLIFVDGHHDGKALLEYMQVLDNHSNDSTLFVLDDIRWSDDMFTAWNELIDSKKYHVCLDLFRYGILIKRSHQEFESFVIRY